MITSVNGINEVKNYPVPCNNNKLFMDLTKDVFYVKDTDKNGKSKIGIYKFKQEDIVYV